MCMCVRVFTPYNFGRGKKEAIRRDEGSGEHYKGQIKRTKE